MNTQRTSLLDDCIELVRQTEPPPLLETDARRMVRRALRASASSPRSRSIDLRWVVALGGFMVIAVGAKMSLTGQPTQQRLAALHAPSGIPQTIRLPTNDIIVAESGARFQIKAAVSNKRQVALDRGAMLFEVEPLQPEQSFEVSTPHARAAVRGTIFSVEVTSTRSVFRVYEGLVQVIQPSIARLIKANEAYATDNHRARMMKDEPLLRQAMAALKVRVRTRPQQQTLEGNIDPNATRNMSGGANRSDMPNKKERAPIADKRSAHKTIPPTLAQAQEWINEGKAELALRMASGACAHGSSDIGEWKIIEADALRMLGRFEEAAGAYTQASLLLSSPRREQAGYLAAQLFYRKLNRPDRTLSILDGAQVDGQLSPLRERALLLRASSMVRMGQSPADVARRYLADYPDSAASEIMRAHISGTLLSY
jgi:tetratricopeptide (TPR) repeat protein